MISSMTKARGANAAAASASAAAAKASASIRSRRCWPSQKLLTSPWITRDPAAPALQARRSAATVRTPKVLGKRPAGDGSRDAHRSGDRRARETARAAGKAAAARATRVCATSTERPAPTPFNATAATISISEESCAHSATSSAPPRRARILSSAERPARPTAMIAQVRKSFVRFSSCNLFRRRDFLTFRRADDGNSAPHQ